MLHLFKVLDVDIGEVEEPGSCSPPEGQGASLSTSDPMVVATGSDVVPSSSSQRRNLAQKVKSAKVPWMKKPP